MNNDLSCAFSLTPEQGIILLLQGLGAAFAEHDQRITRWKLSLISILRNEHPNNAVREWIEGGCSVDEMFDNWNIQCRYYRQVR
ncbi:hypothetical protein [Rhizorhabdus argentea]|uniref:hypothetical protein n=1 Tax=Rhizorhabdus argentea TaxID=1387174 RepID=UPI0030EEB38A